MLVKIYLFLCCSLLLVVAGCRSDTAQQSNATLTSTTASTASTTSPVIPETTPAQNANGQSPTSNANTGVNSAAASKRPDNCSLLTSKDLQDVMGIEVKDTKGSQQADGAFAVAQCYYLMAEPSKSVVVTVYDSNSENAAAQTPRDFWKQRFGSAAVEGKEKEREREREGERDRDKARDKDAEKVRDKARKGEIEEEEEAAPPRPVKGVGDEAYWTGNQVVGALYVLKKNSFIRISVGGTDSMETKIKKTKALAQKIVSRL